MYRITQVALKNPYSRIICSKIIESEHQINVTSTNFKVARILQLVIQYFSM